MRTEESFLLVVSRNEELCGALRRVLAPVGSGLHLRVAASPEEARRMAWDEDPDLIVLEESACRAPEENLAEPAPTLAAALTLLSGFAPVVVLGPPRLQEELAPLLAAKSAEFIALAGNHLREVLARIERRLWQSRRESVALPVVEMHAALGDEDFGEILRHELNNPLTGILGNAELLLTEVRRRKDGRLPQDAQQRLETITALAVRLRETVRRLSQQLEERHTRAAV
jgi:signal transduction histidine kinase